MCKVAQLGEIIVDSAGVKATHILMLYFPVAAVVKKVNVNVILFLCLAEKRLFELFQFSVPVPD